MFYRGVYYIRNKKHGMIPKKKRKGKKMKFSAEELFEIASGMYRKAGFDLDEVREGLSQWAYYSAEEDYADMEEVKEELASLIQKDKEMKETLED